MVKTDSKLRSSVIIAGVYLLALLAVLVIFSQITLPQSRATVLLADVIATILVFLFSMAFRNSSVYDPYWSMAPPVIVVYLTGLFPQGNDTRQLVVLVLVLFWSIRLTGNWWRGWQGLLHQDWRYSSIAEKSGNWYWPVSFLGIHLMPTLFVFLGCLPLWYSLSSPVPFSYFDALASLLTLGAILTEWMADEQLWRFKKTALGNGFMKTGLWAYSRHPNYLGEISFWGGMFLLALTSTGFNTATGFSAFGFLSMVVLFKFISIPLMEKRNRESKLGYPEYQNQVPALFPHLYKMKRFRGIKV